MGRSPCTHDFNELGKLLEQQVDDVVDRMLARAIAELPPEWLVDRPELREPVRDATRSSVLAEIEAFKRCLAVPDTCPEPDAYLARFAAQIGNPLGGMLWGYRAGHRAQWECWNEIVEGLDAPDSDRRELLKLGSEFFFSYADRLCQFATEEYNAEADRLARGWKRRQANIVHDVLAGRNVDSAALDYDLEATHIAMIAWGKDAPVLLREAASITGRRLLSIGLPDNDTWWSWLGATRPLDRDTDAEIDRIAIPTGSGLAIGDEGAGIEGFRRTHHQAGYAHRAGVASDRSVTRYGDVALEVLSSRDEDEARRFVVRELSVISGEDKRMVALRGTLSAYFAAGHNAAATAAALGVHEQTVANRLATIEELLGVNVATRHAELETALRLRTYLA